MSQPSPSAVCTFVLSVAVFAFIALCVHACQGCAAGPQAGLSAAQVGNQQFQK